MHPYEDRVALVTGAASGIGLALSRALVARGARVVLSDIDEASAKTAADSLGPQAAAASLDVRDAASFVERVEEVTQEHGRLDFLFNNAGIGIGGEIHEQSVEHFDRIIDINIRGVTNGIAAAYPGMVARRDGHIVNTASAAGLLPVPLLGAYSMTKHAVVGLSASLRLEAERYGVRVTALCPTAIDTPLLDTKGPTDLEKVWTPHLREYLTRVGGPPMKVDDFAATALDGIAKNRAQVVAPTSARMIALLRRWVPGLVASRTRAALADELGRRG